MSNPKPFLEPDDQLARIKNLERVVKALHTTTRGITVSLPMAAQSAPPDIVAGPAYSTVTGASFETAYGARCMHVTTNAICAFVGVQADVGTTGEVRLLENGNGTPSTVFSITSGFADTVVWTWLHGHALGITDPRRFGVNAFTPQIQARRLTGSGNIYIFCPVEFLLIDGSYISATSGGAPAVQHA